jgi:hypothetical protein
MGIHSSRKLGGSLLVFTCVSVVFLGIFWVQPCCNWVHKRVGVSENKPLLPKYREITLLLRKGAPVIVFLYAHPFGVSKA